MIRPLMASMHFLLNAISSEGRGQAFFRGLEAAWSLMVAEIAGTTAEAESVTISSRSLTARPPTTPSLYRRINRVCVYGLEQYTSTCSGTESDGA